MQQLWVDEKWWNYAILPPSNYNWVWDNIDCTSQDNNIVFFSYFFPPKKCVNGTNQFKWQTLIVYFIRNPYLVFPLVTFTIKWTVAYLLLHHFLYVYNNKYQISASPHKFHIGASLIRFFLHLSWYDINISYYIFTLDCVHAWQMVQFDLINQ